MKYFGIKYRTSKTGWTVFLQRRNPDLDYTWYKDDNSDKRTESSIRAMLNTGLELLYFITPSIQLTGSAILNRNFNQTNDSDDKRGDSQRYNFVYHFSIKYNF